MLNAIFQGDSDGDKKCSSEAREIMQWVNFALILVGPEHWG